MPSTTTSQSDNESRSGSSSPVSQTESVEVSQNGSRKRRRLSPGASDSGSESGSEAEPTPASKQPIVQSRIPASTTISRIKAKASVTAQAPEDVPQSIRTAMKGNETTGFAELGVSPWLVTSLGNMAIKHPTGIQKGCIPEILKGRDCIGGSRTGSGKTVAFAVPILEAFARDPTGIFAVVLTPTRELALQLYEQFAAIGSPQGLKCLLVTGGSEMRAQAIALASRPHVVIATPGRLADHITSSGEDTIAGLRRTRFLVMDEADRLLSAGRGSMLPDLGTCLEVLPPSSKRTTLLFTATVTPEVRALEDQPKVAGKLPPFVCEVDTQDMAIPETLTQTYQLVNVVHKEKYLHVLLSTPVNITKTIIVFCNKTETCNLLEHMLRLLEHRVTSLHSGLPNHERVNNLARFRAGSARILVATGLVSRGLDIKDVACVINYDLPRDVDDYVHRVGRTARAGRKGVAINLVGQRDVALVQAIEARVGREMEQYEEEGVNVETRVVREALNVVGDKKREAMLAIEEGRDVRGKRKRGMGKVGGA